jgi:hypothetical protein
MIQLQTQLAAAELLKTAPDEFLVDAEVFSLLSGYAKSTIQQRRLPNQPATVTGLRLQRWRMADVRRWLAATNMSVGSASSNVLEHERQPLG